MGTSTHTDEDKLLAYQTLAALFAPNQPETRVTAAFYSGDDNAYLGWLAKMNHRHPAIGPGGETKNPTPDVADGTYSHHEPIPAVGTYAKVKKAAFGQQFVMVPSAAIQELAPQTFRALVYVFRHKSKYTLEGEAGDGVFDPVTASKLLGVSLRTLRGWFTNSGPATQYVELRTRSDRKGGRVYAEETYSSDGGHMLWRFDFKQRPTGERFVKVPLWWMWTPYENGWGWKNVDAHGLWAAAMCLHETAGRDNGFKSGVKYLAGDYNILGRVMSTRLAAAEAAGLIEVTQREGGRTSARRKPITQYRHTPPPVVEVSVVSCAQDWWE